MACSTITTAQVADSWSECDNGYSLPLCANVEEVLVSHYSIHWVVDFQHKFFDGCVILHIHKLGGTVDAPNIELDNLANAGAEACPKTVPGGVHPQHFEIILDLYELDITSVYILEDTDPYPSGLLNAEFCKINDLKSLNFSVDSWCVRIWDDSSNPSIICPGKIVVLYGTKSLSCSARWTADDGRSPLVFTPGVLVNDRSLLPCQDAPGLNATWDCRVKLLSAPDTAISDKLSVFMTNESEAYHESKVWIFTSLTPAPISTLGIVIGNFLREQFSLLDGRLLCRLIYGNEQAMYVKSSGLREYLAQCLRSAEELFGAYPFSKLSIWITPSSYESLGMAWPNVIYIHPAVLAEDGGMLVRVAHEIMHAWYGLSIGPKDWSQEWISEGFATYLEDLIHVEAMKRWKMWSSDDILIWLQRRELWKFRLLSDEIQNTDSDLQLLQQDSDSSHIRNGLNYAKLSNQIHYLKGYFLLRHLESVGKDVFLQFLKVWTTNHMGKFILAEQFLFDYFAEFSGHLGMYRSQDDFIAYIRLTWLTQPGLPTELQNDIWSPQNGTLISRYESTKTVWNLVFDARSAGKKKKLIERVPACWGSEDVCLVLDYLKELPELISPEDLQRVRKFYGVDKANAEVRHVFCELIIVNQCEPLCSFVKHFLSREHGMGKCLYSMLVMTPVESFRSVVPEAVALFGKDKDTFWWSEMNKILNTRCFF